MEYNKKQTVFRTIFVSLIVIICVGTIVAERFIPSKETKSLKNYYSVGTNEVLLLMENYEYAKKGIIIDGKIYLDCNTIYDEISQRFYLDSNEKLLIYTTPTEVIKTELGSTNYYINSTENKLDYTITQVKGEEVYVALDYIKLFANVEYKLYKNPNRLVIHSHWGTEYTYAKASKGTQIRESADIKGAVLKQVAQGEKLIYVDPTASTIKGFTKVMSEDGVVGYVKNKHMQESYKEVLENDYEEPVYTSLTSDKTINLVWHQVTQQAANNAVQEKLALTEGVNVISPTWFSIINNDGDISSLASQDYVTMAHSQGAEVWGLVDDFSESIDMKKVLSRTSVRKKLISQLINQAKKYDLDGINVDFENISLEAGRDFVQFIRELSIECRVNKIVLSVDNFVPSAYTEFYNRKEQGIVADYVITMAYDEHFAGSEESGSVASLGYVKDAVKNTCNLVPEEKVIIALPFYTRLWMETGEGANRQITSEPYTMENGQKFLEDNGVKATWDEATSQYYGEIEKNNTKYRIWLEEEKSYEEKLKAVFEYDIAGVGAWKLGLEKDSIWNVIAKYVQ